MSVVDVELTDDAAEMLSVDEPKEIAIEGEPESGGADGGVNDVEGMFERGSAFAQETIPRFLPHWREDQMAEAVINRPFVEAAGHGAFDFSTTCPEARGGLLAGPPNLPPQIPPLRRKVF